MSWFRKTIFPSFIKDYNELDFKVYDSCAIEECEFVVLDAETTGLEKSDMIITMGAVHLKDFQINLNDVLDQNYGHEKGTAAAEVHGELPEMTSRELSELQKELLLFIGNRIIVGHHISFDVSKINQMISTSHSGFKLKNKVLDTAQLLYRFNRERYDNEVGGMNNLQLDIACQENGIPIENRHTALGDAYMTAQLLMTQLTVAQRRGIDKLSKLL